MSLSVIITDRFLRLRINNLLCWLSAIGSGLRLTVHNILSLDNLLSWLGAIGCSLKIGLAGRVSVPAHHTVLFLQSYLLISELHFIDVLGSVLRILSGMGNHWS